MPGKRDEGVTLLFSCIGKRGGYMAEFFRPSLTGDDRIIGTANTAWTPGFHVCDDAFVVPNIGDDAYVPTVLDLCQRERVDAVICVEDEDVHKLSQAREGFLARGVVPLFPSAQTTELAYDKYRWSEFLAANGIATPRTAIALDQADDFAYPLYVKPRRGSGSQHMFVARTRHELEVFFNYAPDMIIQEEVRGQEINIQLCSDLSGRPVGICLLKKRSMRHGETDQAETFRDPAIIDFGLRLGELLGAVGPVDIDVIRHGDSLVVLEANTRFGGGYPVSHLAGADFPRLVLDLIRHGEVREPSFDFAAGVAMLKSVGILGGDSERFFRDELGMT